MRVFELVPCNSRKSFYGKAKVVQINGESILISYDTGVCKIDANGNFVRMWGGYSQTTMHHINSFISYFGIPGGGKAWWDKQEVAQ